jgi:Tfp pilus assembly protein PilF
LSGSANLKAKDDYLKLQKYGIILAAVLVIGGVSLYIAKSIRSTGFLRSPWEILVPLFQAKPDAPGYTLFSLRHLLDVFNEQLLLSPVGGALLLALLILGVRKKTLKNKVVRFLAIVSVFQLMYSFVLDPILGAAGDWDLFSSTALGYTVLAVYLFPRLVRDPQRMRYVGSVLVVTSVISTAPWILLNANTDKSINRTRVLTDLDPKRSKGARSALWAYFEDVGDEQEVSKEQVRMMEGIPELVFYSRGVDHVALGHIDSAMVAFQKAIQIEEFFAEAHYELGVCYARIGRPEEAISEFQTALSSRPKNKVATDCYVWLGDIYSGKRQFDRAAQMYEKGVMGIAINKEKLYQNLGHCYFAKGELDDAISTYQKALKSKPDFADPHMYLGHAYLKKGAKEKAMEEYGLYLKDATDARQMERIETLISKLNQK